MASASSHLELSIDLVARRVNTLANLPADPQNIITMLEAETEKGLSPWEAELVNQIINALDKCDWCRHADGAATDESRFRLPTSPGCDAFAVWGSRTKGGRLFSSRNLDWKKDTGIAAHRLVNVMKMKGVPVYATFGFAITGMSAIAGMNRDGLTVSEMNLDNSETTFEGPPFPLRLRMLLEGARTLEDAKRIWEATNNTDSMNYLIASGGEKQAMVIEAMKDYSSYYGANDSKEADATCPMHAPHGNGGTCGD